MAYKGKLISNPFNRQTIEFLTTAKESGGKMLEMISTWQPYSHKPMAHYHPYQLEEFKIVEGRLTVMLDGKITHLQKDETLSIPAGTAHAMWNDSSEPVVARWKVTPAGNTEYFLETGMGLSTDGKVNKNGLPGILQTALLALKYRKEFRLAKPTYLLQTIVFILLKPFALLVGKKAKYSKYID